MDKLSETEVQDRLSGHPEWTEISGEIQRTFEFADFRASMRFVNEIAEEAERTQHHPDILIRYSKVTLTVSTHDAGGITTKDFELAAFADQASGSATGAAST
ncbi:MAG: 4a-hydroxytetrahydrobiopterin dehydratase [Planctomycetota bacterium]